MLFNFGIFENNWKVKSPTRLWKYKAEKSFLQLYSKENFLLTFVGFGIKKFCEKYKAKNEYLST